MSIEFHCDHCGKFIRTDDKNGGKHGKCPACEQQVYIPSADSEPLSLEPVDEAAEKAAKKHELRSKKLADRLLGGDGDSGVADAKAAPKPKVPMKINVPQLVTKYAIAMAKGELEVAQEISAQLKSRKADVAEAVQRIVADDIPPKALEHIPRPVLMGFLKQL